MEEELATDLAEQCYGEFDEAECVQEASLAHDVPVALQRCRIHCLLSSFLNSSLVLSLPVPISGCSL